MKTVTGRRLRAVTMTVVVIPRAFELRKVVTTQK